MIGLFVCFLARPGIFGMAGAGGGDKSVVLFVFVGA